MELVLRVPGRNRLRKLHSLKTHKFLNLEDILIDIPFRDRRRVHQEHIHEMNLKELRAIARKHGYKVLKTTGIYLELMLNWYRARGVRVDMLIRLFPEPKYKPMYRVFMELGKLLPSRAYDLVIVCRKKK